MRILLDESLPRRLGFAIADLEPAWPVRTVQHMGWSGMKNGQLLQAAAAQFDVLLTADRNIPYQQNPEALPLVLAILSAQTNRFEALLPLIPEWVARLREPVLPRIVLVPRDDSLL